MIMRPAAANPNDGKQAGRRFPKLTQKRVSSRVRLMPARSVIKPAGICINAWDQKRIPINREMVT
jgi:hypothetical protein